MIKRVIQKSGYRFGISHDYRCLSRGNSGEKRLGNLLHVIGHTDEPEEHVKRCPEGRNILCFYVKHKRFLPFKPATGLRAGIDLIAEFRTKCRKYLPGMGCRKPEGCIVKRHTDCLTQE
jgi:hypothetical protein